MHYSYLDRKYIQVRASKHNDIAGNVTLTFSLEETYAEVSSKLINEFFPNGKSSKGHLKNMITQLGNSKGVIIDGNNFTVGQFVRNCATQKPRLYLMTKIRGAVIETDSSDGDDFDLPDIQLKRKRSTPVLPVVTVTQTAVVNSASSPLVSLHSAGPSLHDTGTPTVSFNMDPSPMLCTVCFIELKNTVLIPCGHSLCASCAHRLYGAGDVCPMCRKTIERIQNMFI